MLKVFKNTIFVNSLSDIRFDPNQMLQSPETLVYNFWDMFVLVGILSLKNYPLSFHDLADLLVLIHGEQKSCLSQKFFKVTKVYYVVFVLEELGSPLLAYFDCFLGRVSDPCE